MRVSLHSHFQRERSIATVPRWVLLLFVMALLAHGTLRWLAPRPQATATALESPLPQAWLRVASLGETQALSQWLVLYLQAFDNQPGISLPFTALDYARVSAWLSAALTLDPAAQYPLMMASQLYGQVPDLARQRSMCEWVHQEFLRNPNVRWRWLASTTVER